MHQIRETRIAEYDISPGEYTCEATILGTLTTVKEGWKERYDRRRGETLVCDQYGAEGVES